MISSMRASFVALNLKGMLGLFSGESRCYEKIAVSERNLGRQARGCIRRPTTRCGGERL